MNSGEFFWPSQDVLNGNQDYYQSYMVAGGHGYTNQMPVYPHYTYPMPTCMLQPAQTMPMGAEAQLMMPPPYAENNTFTSYNFLPRSTSSVSSEAQFMMPVGPFQEQHSVSTSFSPIPKSVERISPIRSAMSSSNGSPAKSPSKTMLLLKNHEDGDDRSVKDAEVKSGRQSPTKSLTRSLSKTMLPLKNSPSNDGTSTNGAHKRSPKISFGLDSLDQDDKENEYDGLKAENFPALPSMTSNNNDLQLSVDDSAGEHAAKSMSIQKEMLNIDEHIGFLERVVGCCDMLDIQTISRQNGLMEKTTELTIKEEIVLFDSDQSKELSTSLGYSFVFDKNLPMKGVGKPRFPSANAELDEKASLKLALENFEHRGCRFIGLEGLAEEILLNQRKDDYGLDEKMTTTWNEFQGQKKPTVYEAS